MRVELTGPAGAETIYARKVVLAGGRDGSGAPVHAGRSRRCARGEQSATATACSTPPTASTLPASRAAGSACWAPAPRPSTTRPWPWSPARREVHLFVRRPHLPQVNKSKWTVFPGFFHGYRDLDDAHALAHLHLHLRRGRAAAARVGAALRPPRRLCHAFRRALARRDPVRRRRDGGDGQGALRVRCRDPGDRLLRRPGATAGARALPRQDRAVGRSRHAARRPRATPKRRASPISAPASS